MIVGIAAEQGAQYIIFSTLPSVKDISDSKYTKVTHFEAKAEIEQHIRGLQIKGAFYAPASFMDNFQSRTFLAPKESPDGAWIMALSISPKSRLPLIDTTGDTGKFVAAILAEPDTYEGNGVLHCR
jgi:uncharacterized protein YbjT (DUF2867 family)